jgi:hypothetical protein
MSQFNPNPDEHDFEAGLSLELGNEPPRYRVPRAKQTQIKMAVKKLFSSPMVKSMSGAQKELLKAQIRALFKRINPHVQVVR